MPAPTTSGTPHPTRPPAPPTPSQQPRGADGGAVLRSSFGDDVFLRRHRGLAAPVHNQLAWRYDAALAPAAVEALVDALATGGLARRVDRALVPAARDRWSAADHRPAVQHTDALPPGEALAWLRRHGSVPLDPTTGRGWSVATASLTDGGSLLSLVVSHAVADGGAMVDAATRAGERSAPLVLPPRPALLPALAGDVRDAAGQVAEVLRWGLARLPRGGGSRSSAPAPAPAAMPTPSRPDAPGASPTANPGVDWTTPLAVAEVSAVEVADVAARHGGTPNTWFVALVAGVAARLRGTDAPIPVALPVATREPGDLRANATRIARASISPAPSADPAVPEDPAALDLTAVRAACKDAYRRLAQAAAAAEPVPLALVQMLPDAVVGRLPQPPVAAALASNVGELPDGFVRAAGLPARSVTAIAHQVGAGAAEVRASGGGVAAWMCTTGGRATVSFAGMDPDRVADDEALAAAVLAELDRWGVRAERW
ncbi:hypothetical protein GGQ22_05780 [Nocardioides sp. zg-579]|uniref:Fatty acyl-AMP ligase FadD28 and polyketide synthase n=1 Tax=Nocardioides marmotae TaxID=2663857 RepID=A0A6I3JAI9_9ACTN|nr:hypothetical protein [Nocardioides marmotae]MCR6030949.1 hypothetical protein [Gordonia jinghuaiqii]MTB94585.1 hypothetical protein [Nocardioides marmotae]QKE01404.1 hypothetical protein HPC71_10205 [Nocardioides marmotae]